MNRQSKVAEELLKSLDDSPTASVVHPDQRFEEVNNEFLDPEKFVSFIQALAWDYPSLVLWLMKVGEVATARHREFDT